MNAPILIIDDVSAIASYVLEARRAAASATAEYDAWKARLLDSPWDRTRIVLDGGNIAHRPARIGTPAAEKKRLESEYAGALTSASEALAKAQTIIRDAIVATEDPGYARLLGKVARILDKAVAPVAPKVSSSACETIAVSVAP